MKQELPDYNEEDFEDMIEVQQVGGRGGGGSNMLDQVRLSIIVTIVFSVIDIVVLIVNISLGIIIVYSLI